MGNWMPTQKNHTQIFKRQFLGYINVVSAFFGTNGLLHLGDYQKLQ